MSASTCRKIFRTRILCRSSAEGALFRPPSSVLPSDRAGAVLANVGTAGFVPIFFSWSSSCTASRSRLCSSRRAWSRCFRFALSRESRRLAVCIRPESPRAVWYRPLRDPAAFCACRHASRC